MAAHTGTRAGDADRGKVVDALSTAFAEGQITQPEHEERSRAALQAATLAELRSLTSDLQSSPDLEGVPDAAPLPPTHTTTTGIAIGPWVVRLVSIAFLVGLVWVVVRAWPDVFDDEGEAESGRVSEAPSGDGGGASIPEIVIPSNPDVLSVDGFNRIVELMDDEIGSTTITGLNLHEHTASFETKRPGEPGTYSYYYDGFLGEPSHNEAGTRSGPRIDAADIDVAAVMRLMDGLPERFGIEDPTARYITLQSDTFYSRGPSLDLYVTGGSRTGYLIVELDGTVVHVQAP